MSKFKIMVFTIPASGHINPLWPILKELLKTGDYEITIFLDDDSRSKVESIGAIFKPVINNFKQFLEFSTGKSAIDFYKFQRAFYDIAIDNKEYFCAEIEKEQPDLIIYDFLFKSFVWSAHYYNHYYNLGKTLSQETASKLKFCPKQPFPETVCFSPSMESYTKEIPVKVSIWTVIRIIYLFVLFRIQFGFGLKDFTPFDQPKFAKKLFFCLVPDVQEKSHLFDQKRYRFLGSTVKENFSDPRAQEEIFKNILNNNDYILIYASLGTVFKKKCSNL